jgi:hypothetical protein
MAHPQFLFFAPKNNKETFATGEENSGSSDYLDDETIWDGIFGDLTESSGINSASGGGNSASGGGNSASPLGLQPSASRDDSINYSLLFSSDEESSNNDLADYNIDSDDSSKWSVTIAKKRNIDESSNFERTVRFRIDDDLLEIHNTAVAVVQNQASVDVNEDDDLYTFLATQRESDNIPRNSEQDVDTDNDDDEESDDNVFDDLLDWLESGHSILEEQKSIPSSMQTPYCESSALFASSPPCLTRSKSCAANSEYDFVSGLSVDGFGTPVACAQVPFIEGSPSENRPYTISELDSLDPEILDKLLSSSEQEDDNYVRQRWRPSEDGKQTPAPYRRGKSRVMRHTSLSLSLPLDESDGDRTPVPPAPRSSSRDNLIQPAELRAFHDTGPLLRNSSNFSNGQPPSDGPCRVSRDVTKLSKWSKLTLPNGATHRVEVIYGIGVHPNELSPEFCNNPRIERGRVVGVSISNKTLEEEARIQSELDENEFTIWSGRYHGLYYCRPDSRWVRVDRKVKPGDYHDDLMQEPLNTAVTFML